VDLGGRLDDAPVDHSVSRSRSVEADMKELALVVLSRSVPDHGLEAGDVGTVLHVYPDGEAAEVEFVRADGETVAVVTLEKSSLRAFDGEEILHARKLAS
jgi:hypothetical protein